MATLGIRQFGFKLYDVLQDLLRRLRSGEAAGLRRSRRRSQLRLRLLLRRLRSGEAAGLRRRLRLWCLLRLHLRLRSLLWLKGGRPDMVWCCRGSGRGTPMPHFLSSIPK